MTQTPEQLAAELYDLAVPDWDGEIDFYREFACKVKDRGGSVLEAACGKGGVTLRLAQEGVNIVGVDIDEEKLKVARKKEELTQINSVVSKWEEISNDGSVLQTWERGPLSLHSVFRVEMEHLLARIGFEERIVYGDFFKNALNEKISDMIWVARNP